MRRRSLARELIHVVLPWLVGAACTVGRSSPIAPPTVSHPATTTTRPALTPTRIPAQTAAPTVTVSLPTAGPATLTPSPTAAVADTADFLARPFGDAVRVLSYNINWDSIFPPLDPESHDLRIASRGPAFARLVAAVQPDVVCLQEINPKRDPAETAALLEAALAPPGGETWSATNARDALIASRYPVITDGYQLNAPAFPLELAQAAALIDLPDEQFGAVNLYVICAHFKSGGGSYDILLRQRQADVIMAQVGEALTPGGKVDLPAGTPMVILGDFNIYTTDPAHHLATLLTGDIVNEDRYGPDVIPDWDGTSLADAHPSHNDLGQPDYTWRNDAAPQAPGALDRILYTDSVLVLEHTFIFDTTLMSASARETARVSETDVILDPPTGDFDHLPLVADLRPAP